MSRLISGILGATLALGGGVFGGSAIDRHHAEHINLPQLQWVPSWQGDPAGRHPQPAHGPRTLEAPAPPPGRPRSRWAVNTAAVGIGVVVIDVTSTGATSLYAGSYPEADDGEDFDAMHLSDRIQYRTKPSEPPQLLKPDARVGVMFRRNQRGRRRLARRLRGGR